MAVPKRKHSNSRTGTRRAHDSIKLRQFEHCRTCGKAVPTHCICANCGTYMGRTVVDTEDKA